MNQMAAKMKVKARRHRVCVNKQWRVLSSSKSKRRTSTAAMLARRANSGINGVWHQLWRGTRVHCGISAYHYGGNGCANAQLDSAAARNTGANVAACRYQHAPCLPAARLQHRQ